ncbi:hypothetical protein M0R45_009789 [Rubus argutus]|uniref:Uncharacterized protein n=1 Tax=Rubus argutus TaxID=59490 RepID=A0AAW1Y654_RUBAR
MGFTAWAWVEHGFDGRIGGAAGLGDDARLGSELSGATREACEVNRMVELWVWLMKPPWVVMVAMDFELGSVDLGAQNWV